ncbi:MAG: hypothetical protein IAA89_04505, partial [Firmicutes bacterium]|nr:hypothetical protein [Candidatus Gallilactobacillus intestinavium]
RQQLNTKLHEAGIDEKLRSQFVGMCLLALKNGLTYRNLEKKLNEDGIVLTTQAQVLNNINKILSGLNSINKIGKLYIITNKILSNQDVLALSYEELTDILTKFFIKSCFFCLNSSCVAVREAVQEW